VIKIAIIDGNSLHTTAFFSSPAVADDTRPCNAVRGVYRMLAAVLEWDPTHIVCVWDAHDTPKDFCGIEVFSRGRGTRAHRRAVYEYYKDDRSALPDSLLEQIPETMKLFKVMGIKSVYQKDTEGDDIISEITCNAVAADADVVIYTGDKDMFALCQYPKVKVHYIRNHINYDVDSVVDVFRVSAEQIPLFKGLAGDASDNIPGVYGIGKKGAADIINLLGDYEGIIKEANDLTHLLPAKIHERLVSGYDDFVMSYELASFIPVAVPAVDTWLREQVVYSELKECISKYNLDG